jgi:hypothetical protein
MAADASTIKKSRKHEMEKSHLLQSFTFAAIISIFYQRNWEIKQRLASNML